jgi:hypothetical protein
MRQVSSTGGDFWTIWPVPDTDLPPFVARNELRGIFWCFKKLRGNGTLILPIQVSARLRGKLDSALLDDDDVKRRNRVKNVILEIHSYLVEKRII